MNISEEIEFALRKLHNLNKREENSVFDRNMFVDNQQITQLDTADWQIIYGRRGTGKTTLLSAFNDHITKIQDSSHCIFIDIRDCIPSASGVRPDQESDFELALGYFYEFTRRFAQNLLDEYTENEDLSSLQKLIRKFRGNHKRIDDLVIEICEIAEYHPFYIRVTDGTLTESEQVVSNVNQGYSAGVGVNLGGLSSKVGAKGSTEFAKSEQTKGQIVTENRYIVEASRRYQPLKRRLEELLSLINASRLYILIDEWADLSRGGDNSTQPIFAELLRKTFSGSEKVSVKLASIKGSTKLNIWDEKGGGGLEIDADIFVACDLDQVYVSNENSISFFEELIFKRMCKVNANLLRVCEKDKSGNIKIVPPKNFSITFLRMKKFSRIL